MAAPSRPDPEDRYHGFLSFQSRGVVAIPAELRRRLHADTPGAQIEIIEREDGVFELRPTLPIPADQQWFWTRRWQAMERRADEDIAAGRVKRFESGEELLDHLASLE